MRGSGIGRAAERESKEGERENRSKERRKKGMKKDIFIAADFNLDEKHGLILNREEEREGMGSERQIQKSKKWKFRTFPTANLIFLAQALYSRCLCFPSHQNENMPQAKS